MKAQSLVRRTVPPITRLCLRLAVGVAFFAATLTAAQNDPTLTVQLPTVLREGDPPLAGTVQLPGVLASNIVITLTSSDTTEATVPGTVTIPAGQTSETFTLTVVDDTVADGTQPVTITASAPGFTNGVATGQVRDNDAHHFTLQPIATTQIAGAPVTLVITVRDAANAVITHYNGTVQFSASGSTVAVAVTPTSANGFVNGLWSGSVQIANPANNVVLTVNDGLGHTGSREALI